MAAAAAVSGEAPPPPAPCSAEVMRGWMEGHGIPTDLAPEALRAARAVLNGTVTLWRLAAQDGRIDVFEFLKSQGNKSKEHMCDANELLTAILMI